MILSYSITGKQSIERLAPLLDKVDSRVSFQPADDTDKKAPNFVWETTCTKELREIHKQADVINKLHNSHILESKSNLAFLQLKISESVLQTFIVVGKSEFSYWAKKQWSDQILDEEKSLNRFSAEGWWVVKASKGNGGRDVWVVNKSNWKSVLEELSTTEEYVIQRYVDRPLLYKNKKFHFRCYTAMLANASSLVYRKAFILTAGEDFDYLDEDPSKHITNLSVNKHFEGHPGQIPCDLFVEYPEIYEQIKKLWHDIVQAASPFMSYQTNIFNFEFFGLDVIADVDNKCWLIEINRLPGLETSKNYYKKEEDILYDEMMLSLLKIILTPYIDKKIEKNLKKTEKSEIDTATPSIPTVLEKRTFSSDLDLWEFVLEKEFNENEILKNSDTWKNLFNWRLFTKKNRNKVFVSSN